MSEDELIGMFIENSDEPYAKQIASAIMKEMKKGHRIDTTTKLRETIETALAFFYRRIKKKKDIVKKSCQRVFQALRIDVNSEFEVLDQFLYSLPGCAGAQWQSCNIDFSLWRG